MPAGFMGLLYLLLAIILLFPGSQAPIPHYNRNGVTEKTDDLYLPGFR